MRTIKFRFWDVDSKAFYYANIGDVILTEYVICGYIPEQFTGLHDKNGKEIYEGDIVEWIGGDHDHICHSVVVFDNQKWQPYLSDFMEIIGNIHENQELLK